MTPGEYLKFRLDERKRDLAEAEAAALAAGKERFDLARLEELFGDDLVPEREDSLRSSYYVFHTELRTLAEFAELLKELAVWD
jgi:hypothetical protein